MTMVVTYMYHSTSYSANALALSDFFTLPLAKMVYLF